MSEVSEPERKIVYRVRDIVSGKWWNGCLYRPAFSDKRPHFWNKETAAQKKCNDYFVNLHRCAEYYDNAPHTLEILKFEITERVMATSEPICIDAGYVDTLSKFDKALGGYLIRRDFHKFVAKTVMGKTKYRHFI